MAEQQQDYTIPEEVIGAAEPVRIQLPGIRLVVLMFPPADSVYPPAG